MKLRIGLSRRRISLCTAVALVLYVAVSVSLSGGFLPTFSSACAQDKEAHIWPVKERCDIPFESDAIPKVVSVADAMKKFGPNDFRTWRSEYFEKRLKLKDHPYRSEHSSFEDVKKRGAVFNVWTGAQAQLYGMPPESFRCLVWPGVGCERIGEQCGYGNENVTAAVHTHGPMVGEVITMFVGEGEGYISDHWFAMAEGGDFLYAPRTSAHGMGSSGRITPYKKGWVGTGFAAPAQWELYTMFKKLVVDETPEAKAKGWKQVYKFQESEDGRYGLLGTPSYLMAPFSK